MYFWGGTPLSVAFTMQNYSCSEVCFPLQVTREAVAAVTTEAAMAAATRWPVVAVPADAACEENPTCKCSSLR